MPFIGEIRIFAGSFPPAGWAFCDGAPMPISENDALFVVLGTTYGGDGEETFNLPDLRGRVPLHKSSTTPLGANGGVESVTLTTQQMPSHSHAMLATSDVANTPNPNDNVLGRSGQVLMFFNGSPSVAMSNTMLSPDGGSQPHENLQPYLGLNFIISLFGIFPSPT
jgi:microcystin-dependent protein